MKKIVEYKLADGINSVWIEIEEPDRQGVAPVSRGSAVAEKAHAMFEDTLDQIKPAVSALAATLRDLADSPDETSVEFGVKFSAKAGVVFASADAEANFVFKLTWKRKPDPTQP